MNSGNVLFHHRLCEKLFWANVALESSMFVVDAIDVVPQHVARMKFQLKGNKRISHLTLLTKYRSFLDKEQSNE